MLQIKDLSITYDGARVVDRVSFTVDTDDSIALLGPNGSGKTSIARAIAGLVPFTGDVVVMDGVTAKSLKGLPPWSITRSGIVYISEGSSISESLSVRDTLAVVFASCSTPLAIAQKLMSEIHERFPLVRERAHQVAGTLSGGQKKLLAIARGLLLLRTLKASKNPAHFPLLIIDEPTHGLSPKAVDDVREVLRGLIDVPLLLIEQTAAFALDVCPRGYILRNGVIVGNGTSQALGREALLQLYLGPLGGPTWNN